MLYCAAHVCLRFTYVLPLAPIIFFSITRVRFSSFLAVVISFRSSLSVYLFYRCINCQYECPPEGERDSQRASVSVCSCVLHGMQSHNVFEYAFRICISLVGCNVTGSPSVDFILLHFDLASIPVPLNAIEFRQV